MWDYNPFQERPLPPMSAAMFAALVTARLRGVPNVEIEGHKELELALRVNGEPLTARLEAWYERYREQPGQLTPLVDELIQALLEGKLANDSRYAEAALPDEFASVAARLYPLLMSAAEWQAKREQGLRLVIRPLLQDLGTALVIDEGEQFVFVELPAIPHWHVDAETLYARAAANLEAASREAPFAEVGEGVDKLLVDRGTDGYAATRLLVHERLEDWASRVEGNLVLGLPHRDLLIGMSEQHPAREALLAQVAEDHASNIHGLLPQLVRYREGKLEIVGD